MSQDVAPISIPSSSRHLQSDSMLHLHQISQQVSTVLGFDDTDHTVASFIVNLYHQAQAQPGDIAANFRAQLAANDGLFPEEFIDLVISILQPEPQIQTQTQHIKQEYSALSIPNGPSPTSPIKEEPEPAPIKQEPAIKQEPSIKTEPSVKQEPDFIQSEIKSEPVQPIRNDIRSGAICSGTITNLTPFGAFVRLNSRTGFVTGMVHVSQISYDGSFRIRHPQDVLKLQQQVYVKVLLVSDIPGKRNQKISLTMRGVDQETGLDRSRELQAQGQHHQSQGRNEGLVPSRGREQTQSNRPKRRLTSPEKWEIRQLIASGVAKAEDYPELNVIHDVSDPSPHNEDIDVGVEVKFDEPKFLKGQSQDVHDLEPARIVKNPEGSMTRAALKGSNLAKKVREKRHQEQKDKAKEEKLQQARNRDLIDPMKPAVDSQTQGVIQQWKKAQANASYGKRTTLSMKEQRESLPVFAYREELVKQIKENQFMVIVGETGSGKTTQIVQYLAEEGFNHGPNSSHKIIGCTQPRRVAAVSVAQRVAQERGTRLGQDVGYTIRFEDNSQSLTNIKYMTDGMLQREAITDPLMSKYSVIMLDEAHERTIATDVLFALLKKAALSNPDLKVLITSATLDSKKFSKFFNDCPIIQIPGRTYPVEVLFTKEPEMDYLSAALNSVIQIHVAEPQGDILVFLTGQDEIDTSCEILLEKVSLLGDTVGELIILPVYASLPSEMQSKIFEPTPAGSRKVILATNIAETSITIDGIYYVVDPGFVKINAYDPKLGMDSLVISPISQSQANQRSGRAGRTGPGKCYRLYTEKAFAEEMLPNTIPEIQRTNLSNTILLLKAMGINDLLNFEFMDPPKAQSMLNALQDLYTIGALDDEGYLTRLGKKMSNFPMEPKLAKTLICSVEFGCSEEILTIVSMLSVQSVFHRPKEKASLADQRKARFNHTSGDHLSLLNVYRSWVLNGYNKNWCRDNFIQDRVMRKVQDVKTQLTKIMQKTHSAIVSCGLDNEKIIKSLCAGFFRHAAKRNHQEGFKTLIEGTTVHLHPSSSLQNKNPDYVVYHNLLLTTKEYMHCATVINPQYLIELVPHFFKPASQESQKKQKIVPLYDKFKTDDSWRLSTQISNKKRVLNESRK